VSVTLTPLRFSLSLVVIAVAAFAYLQFRSGWIEVDERDFDRRVLRSSVPALVYFDTAIGCRGGDVVFRDLSRRWRGMGVYYVNTIDHPGLARRYGVGNDVLFVLFERGREVKRATAPEIHTFVAAKNNGFYSDEVFLSEMERFANLRP